jgi:hypothetical protein
MLLTHLDLAATNIQEGQAAGAWEPSDKEVGFLMMQSIGQKTVFSYSSNIFLQRVKPNVTWP